MEKQNELREKHSRCDLCANLVAVVDNVSGKAYCRDHASLAFGRHPINKSAADRIIGEASQEALKSVCDTLVHKHS